MTFSFNWHLVRFGLLISCSFIVLSLREGPPSRSFSFFVKLDSVCVGKEFSHCVTDEIRSQQSTFL